MNCKYCFINFVFSSIFRIAVVLFGPNCYCRIYDPEKGGLSYHLLGLHQTKLRQLEKKGFKVVKVSELFYAPLGKMKRFNKMKRLKHDHIGMTIPRYTLPL